MARKRMGLLTVLSVLCFCLAFPGVLSSHAEGLTNPDGWRRPQPLRFSLPADFAPDSGPFVSTEPDTSSIKEFIPAKYKKRYLKWKDEYLSTGVGRSQWERYARDPDFTLTITISRRHKEGALVNGFRWNDEGKLLAATITLGDKLESGYPTSPNYPITCSLAPGNLPPEVKGTILAATKLAHEFGHLNRTMESDGRLYDLQNRLMLEYNEIFSKNGRNTNDPRLLELVAQMKGTPVSISQDRESWAEMGALLYLQERFKDRPKVKMPQPLRQAIEAYYLTYPGRDWSEPSPRQ